MLLASTVCGALGGADGRSGGGRLESCRRCIQEVCTGTLLVLTPLVLVQPLVEDLDHSIFFQDLSIQSTDPGTKPKPQKTHQKADKLQTNKTTTI